MASGNYLRIEKSGYFKSNCFFVLIIRLYLANLSGYEAQIFKRQPVYLEPILKIVEEGDET
jgi:hypothetical protein